MRRVEARRGRLWASLVVVSLAIGLVAMGPQGAGADTSAGTVHAWGANEFGQLADGSSGMWFENYPVPRQVQSLSDVVGLSASAFHGLAVKADGTVWSWGANESGQLGNGTTRTTPPGGPGFTPAASQVATLSGVKAVAAGGSQSLALKSDGTVWAWGKGFPGAQSVAVPLLVPGLRDIVAIAAGESHALALRRDGVVFSWGANESLQLGRQGPTAGIPAPLPVDGVNDAVAIAAGGTSSVAARADGSVVTWGAVIPTGGSTPTSAAGLSATPIPVAGVTDAVAVSASSWFTQTDPWGNVWHYLGYGVAIRRDGSLVEWGAHGGPGGTARDVTTPGPVVSVSAGVYGRLAALADGTVVAWGSNAYHVYGGGSGTQDAPGPVPGLSGVASVTEGRFSHFAVHGQPVAPNPVPPAHPAIGVAGCVGPASVLGLTVLDRICVDIRP